LRKSDASSALGKLKRKRKKIEVQEEEDRWPVRSKVPLIYNPTEVIVSLLLLLPSYPIISNRPPSSFLLLILTDFFFLQKKKMVVVKQEKIGTFLPPPNTPFTTTKLEKELTDKSSTLE
jgi:hypothetical protein